MTKLIYKTESYKIIGIYMEVHNNLGTGFLEIVYKDALEYELHLAGIPYKLSLIINFGELNLNYKRIVK